MNEIRFTQAQMQAAMEHYLNEVVLKQRVKVTQVEYNTQQNANVFVIKTAEPDKSAVTIINNE